MAETHGGRTRTSDGFTKTPGSAPLCKQLLGWILLDFFGGEGWLLWLVNYRVFCWERCSCSSKVRPGSVHINSLAWFFGKKNMGFLQCGDFLKNS